MLLRSRQQDPQLWESLRGFFPAWTHVVPVVAHWNVAMHALTRRMLSILFGPTEGMILLLSYLRRGGRERKGGEAVFPQALPFSCSILLFLILHLPSILNASS